MDINALPSFYFEVGSQNQSSWRLSWLRIEAVDLNCCIIFNIRVPNSRVAGVPALSTSVKLYKQVNLLRAAYLVMKCLLHKCKKNQCWPSHFWTCSATRNHERVVCNSAVVCHYVDMQPRCFFGLLKTSFPLFVVLPSSFVSLASFARFLPHCSPSVPASLLPLYPLYLSKAKDSYSPTEGSVWKWTMQVPWCAHPRHRVWEEGLAFDAWLTESSAR